jgi:hypothetical protein
MKRCVYRRRRQFKSRLDEQTYQTTWQSNRSGNPQTGDSSDLKHIVVNLTDRQADQRRTLPSCLDAEFGEQQFSGDAVKVRVVDIEVEFERRFAPLVEAAQEVVSAVVLRDVQQVGSERVASTCNAKPMQTTL